MSAVIGHVGLSRRLLPAHRHLRESPVRGMQACSGITFRTDFELDEASPAPARSACGAWDRMAQARDAWQNTADLHG
jgi:hypothetical protein